MENSKIEVWRLKLKAVAVTTVGAVVITAQIMGQDGAVVLTGIGAVVGIVGSKIFNVALARGK
jgi:hypothetical protein